MEERPGALRWGAPRQHPRLGGIARPGTIKLGAIVSVIAHARVENDGHGRTPTCGLHRATDDLAHYPLVAFPDHEPVANNQQLALGTIDDLIDDPAAWPEPASPQPPAPVQTSSVFGESCRSARTPATVPLSDAASVAPSISPSRRPRREQLR